MTSKPIAPPMADEAVEQFPDFSINERFPDFYPRDDMQNTLHLNIPGYLTGLWLHFGSRDSTIVLSEAPLGWNHRQRGGILIPDLLIAFDVSQESGTRRMGYSINEQGKPPDFVLEIASPTTADNDFTYKRVRYAQFGVPEYWRFDAFGGDYYPTGLAGDRLVGSEYQPIPIADVDADHSWGHSAALNLDLCWEEGELRFYDPVARSYLLTHADQAEGRLAAEAQRDAAQAQRDAAQARVRQLEEEVRRLRE